jgi:Uma2 family endonuclease
MASVGLLDGERLELIDGELIQKMVKNNPHVMTVRWLHQWLVAAFGYGRIQKEDPIDVAPEDNEGSEPEPDLTVLRAPRGAYRSNPGPPDILLVIEVADSTRSFDLSKKADLYARAGIPDYWVFDTNQREVIVHGEPGHGKYSSVSVYREDESVAPLAAPQLQLKVAAAFDPNNANA